MPIIESAKKRVRRNARFEEINKKRKSRMRSFVKKVEKAVEEENLDQAKELLPKADRELQRASGKGAIHKNKAARIMSRLARMVKELDQAQA